jgi:4'-phosphopantetheinyl transferase
MNADNISKYVRCSFGSGEEFESDAVLPAADVFVLWSRDFAKELNLPGNSICRDDILKASRLKNAEYQQFILNGYAILRLILAQRLKCKPGDITYTILKGGKPVIKDSSLFFNISHTRTSFAFSVSDGFYNGLDLEEINPEMNFIPVIKRFFSESEVQFILEDEKQSRERFYLLWTRKEALLKSTGTGIIDNLSTVEVFRPVNVLHREMFACFSDYALARHHYIYSGMIENSSLSIALPCRARVVLHTPVPADFEGFL